MGGWLVERGRPAIVAEVVSGAVTERRLAARKAFQVALSVL